MIKFDYNNAININIANIYFKPKYKYFFYIFYKEDFSFFLKVKILKKYFLNFKN